MAFAYGDRKIVKRIGSSKEELDILSDFEYPESEDSKEEKSPRTLLSRQLADFLGFESTYVDCILPVFNKTSEYVKKNNLVDPKNETLILPNTELAAFLDIPPGAVLRSPNIYLFLYRHYSCQMTDNFVLAETDPAITAPLEMAIRATF